MQADERQLRAALRAVRSGRPVGFNVPMAYLKSYFDFEFLAKYLISLVPQTGLEPVTPSLRMKCSTDWAVAAAEPTSLENALGFAFG
jgi:hypothetical protein